MSTKVKTVITEPARVYENVSIPDRYTEVHAKLLSEAVMVKTPADNKTLKSILPGLAADQRNTLISYENDLYNSTTGKLEAYMATISNGFDADGYPIDTIIVRPAGDTIPALPVDFNSSLVVRPDGTYEWSVTEFDGGTEFPEEPVTGQMFYNELLRCTYLYNGTTWEKHPATALLGRLIGLPFAYPTNSWWWNTEEYRDRKTDGEQVGMICTWYGYGSPDGYLRMDGSQFLRTAYPDLVEYVYRNSLAVSEAQWQSNINYQSFFSNGDEVSTMRLPDLRGVFIRMADFGRNLAPGVNLGEYKPDTLKAHTHRFTDRLYNESGATTNNIASGGNSADSNYDKDIGTTGDTETAPKAVGMNFCIRAKRPPNFISSDDIVTKEFQTWVPYSIPYTAFKQQGSTVSVEIAALAAMGTLTAIKLKHTIKFTTTDATQPDYIYASVGTQEDPGKYSRDFLISSDVSNTNIQTTMVGFTENAASSSGVYLTLRMPSNFNFANLNAGQIAVWLEMTDNATFQRLATTISTGNVPVGTITLAPLGEVAAGWLACDGTIKNASIYQDLYDKIGTMFNIGGEIEDQFRVPYMVHSDSRLIYVIKAFSDIADPGAIDESSLIADVQNYLSVTNERYNEMMARPLTITGCVNAGSVDSNGEESLLYCSGNVIAGVNSKVTMATFPTGSTNDVVTIIGIGSITVPSTLAAGWYVVTMNKQGELGIVADYFIQKSTPAGTGLWLDTSQYFYVTKQRLTVNDSWTAVEAIAVAHIYWDGTNVTWLRSMPYNYNGVEGRENQIVELEGSAPVIAHANGGVYYGPKNDQAFTSLTIQNFEKRPYLKWKETIIRVYPASGFTINLPAGWGNLNNLPNSWTVGRWYEISIINNLVSFSKIPGQ